MRRYWWLLLLAGCGQLTAERQPAGIHTQAGSAPVKPAALAKPLLAYTSGDQEATGQLDTLHVGREGLVLRLVPGSKRDFPPGSEQYNSFYEARLIRQEGDGRVRRAGPTLVVRPFDGPVLRFTDNAHQLRKDKRK